MHTFYPMSENKYLYMNKTKEKIITINIIAHDGIISLYTGVGRVVLDSIAVLSQNKNIDFRYKVNAITGAYTEECLGYNKEIEKLNNALIKKTGGKIYKCINTSSGNVSYGTPEHWMASSVSAATIIKNISSLDSLTINLCFDTPFALVPKYFSQYKDENNIFVWIPHSTGKLHKTDSAITTSESYANIRLQWEQNSIDYINSSTDSFVGYIGKYMKQHLINDYMTEKNKLIDFTNGLNTENKKFKDILTQEQIKRVLDENRIPTDVPLLLAFGRLEPYKGFDRAIKVGGRLATKGYKTLILSQPYSPNDPLIDEYKKLMKKYNPEGIFLYKDFSFDLPHILMQWHNTKVLLIPSKVEPFGLIPEEARLYRNPEMRIAISQVDGLTEQVSDGIDGFLVDFTDTIQATQKISVIADLTKESHAKIVEKGYQRVIEDYNLQKNLSKSISQLINI